MSPKGNYRTVTPRAEQNTHMSTMEFRNRLGRFLVLSMSSRDILHLLTTCQLKSCASSLRHTLSR